MRVIYDRLYRLMADSGVSTRDLAAIAGTNTIAVWLKLRGIMQWKLTEVVRICCFFSVVDAEYLFSN